MSDPATPETESGGSLFESTDLQANPALQRFKTTDELAAEYLEAQKLIGRKGMIVPQDEKDEAAWSQVWKALGRPESPESYKLDGFEPPKDVDWDPAFQSEMVALMHKTGLNERQARDLLAGYAGYIAKSVGSIRAEQTQSYEANAAKLRTEWGKAFDSNLQVVGDALDYIFGPEAGDQIRTLQLADGSLLGNHIDFVKGLYNVGKNLREAKLIGEKSTRTTHTPSEATDQLRVLKADKGFMTAYLDKDHPEHAAAVKRMEALHEASAPADTDPLGRARLVVP